MSNTGNRFRTVAFGGFHKQDVLDYITSFSKDYQNQIAGLKQKTEQAQRENAQLAEKAESAEAARSELVSEREWLSAELAQRTAALEQAQRELAELKQTHEKAAARLAELEEKLPGLEEDAAAYTVLKDRTATIELEAHCKAQETVEQAQAQAARIRGELENWLRRVQSGYQHLRTDVLDTVVHLHGELEQCKTVLEEAEPAFRQHDESLTELLQCERAAAGPKAPEPLPLEEEEDG